MTANLTAVRTELEARLERLVTRIDAIERDLRRQMHATLPEQAQRQENDQVLEGLDDVGLAEIQQIRHALGRIDEGVYGDCVRCDNPIKPGRLKALPYATTCIRCASLADA